MSRGKGFYYIECRIKASDEESIIIDRAPPVIATASMASSPVQRLSDLERAKSFLTAKEFEQKREEIISQL